VVPEDYKQYFEKFVREYVRGTMTVDLVIVEEMMGSVDGLRAVADRIRGDFFCLSADFITQFSLSDLVMLHRLNASDVSMVMCHSRKDEVKDDIDQEFVALSSDGRVLMKVPVLEVDAGIQIPKALVHRASPFRLRNDLNDMGIYLFSHWLLEFIEANKRFSSIRNDVLPYIISRQYQDRQYLFDHIPALEHRKRPLAGLEAWISASKKTQTLFEAQGERDNDLLRCFAVVYEPKSTSTSTATSSSGANSKGNAAANAANTSSVIITRLTSIASYVALNK
jgi:hypothetical protein